MNRMYIYIYIYIYLSISYISISISIYLEGGVYYKELALVIIEAG